MLETNLSEMGLIGPHNPFTKEQERERESKRTEEFKPIADELDRWRAESIYGRKIPVFYAA